jgi:hypothetical protein
VREVATLRYAFLRSPTSRKRRCAVWPVGILPSTGRDPDAQHGSLSDQPLRPIEPVRRIGRYVVSPFAGKHPLRRVRLALRHETRGPSPVHPRDAGGQRDRSAHGDGRVRVLPSAALRVGHGRDRASPARRARADARPALRCGAGSTARPPSRTSVAGSRIAGRELRPSQPSSEGRESLRPRMCLFEPTWVPTCARAHCAHGPALFTSSPPRRNRELTMKLAVEFPSVAYREGGAAPTRCRPGRRSPGRRRPRPSAGGRPKGRRRARPGRRAAGGSAGRE